MSEEYNRQDLAERLAKRLFELGFKCEAADLLDADFSFKSLARLGYSLSVTAITPEVYIQKRMAAGLLPETSMLDHLRELGCVYSYQLQGNEYVERGSHASPILPDAWLTAATALHNVLANIQEKGLKADA